MRLPSGGEALLSKHRGRQCRWVSHSSSWCTKVGWVRRPGTLVRRGAGGVWSSVGGRVALERRRNAMVAVLGGVGGFSSQDTALALGGGEGNRSRSEPLSEMTARPGDTGTESSTAMAGIFPPKVVFFLQFKAASLSNWISLYFRKTIHKIGSQMLHNVYLLKSSNNSYSDLCIPVSKTLTYYSF